MSWTSLYNSISEKDMVRQLMAIIQRDQRAALDSVGGANVLPSFASYYFSETAIRQYPALMLRAPRVQFDSNAELFRRATHTLACAVAVQHQNPEEAVELLEDTVEAMNRLLNSISLADFHTPLTLTHPKFGGALALNGLPAEVSIGDLRVLNHDTTASARVTGGFAMAGILTLEIDTTEGTTA